MDRRAILLLGATTMLSACVGGIGGGVPLGPDGKPLPQVYKIGELAPGVVEYRFLDALNALRTPRGLSQVTLNAELNAAAATHSRDMSLQNRPWHFGSDGSSPLTRVQRVGYTGRLVGELISETYETELETLANWMRTPDQRAVLLDPAVTEIGFAWFQESNGKIWWTLVTGSRGGFAAPVAGGFGGALPQG